jgi:hypothetical protein
VALALCGILQAVDGVALTQAVVFRSDRPALLTLKRRPGDAPEDEVLAAPSLVRQRQSTMRQLGALTGINSTGLRRALDRTADRPTVKLAVVPAVVGARLQAADLPGLLVTQAPRRGYPYSPALCSNASDDFPVPTRLAVISAASPIGSTTSRRRSIPNSGSNSCVCCHDQVRAGE